jgi:hypothetical protein
MFLLPGALVVALPQRQARPNLAVSSAGFNHL